MTTTKAAADAATIAELQTRVSLLEEQVRFLFGLPPRAFPRAFYEQNLANVLDSIGEKQNGNVGTKGGKRRK